MPRPLDGMTLRYQYPDGLAYEVVFVDGRVTSRQVDATGRPRLQHFDLPYQARYVREDVVHVAWHVPEKGDFVSLVVDLQSGQVFSAVLLDYRSENCFFHFEPGQLEQAAVAA